MFRLLDALLTRLGAPVGDWRRAVGHPRWSAAWRSSSSASDGRRDPYVVKSPYPDIRVSEELTIPKFVWKDIELWADRPALTCGVTGRSYLYREARELSRRVGAGLLDSGWWSSRSEEGGAPMCPGQVLATLMPNTPEYPIVVMGALEAGLTVTTVNPNYTPEEISKQLSDSGSVCVVTVPELVGRLREVKSLLKKRNRHQAETLRLLVAPSCQPVEAGAAEDATAGLGSLKELMNEQVDCRPSLLDRQPVIASSCLHGSDIAFLPYSSGTTGLPKGVCLTHTNVISNLVQLSNEEIRNQLPTTDEHQEVVPVILPMFHIYGLSVLMLQGLCNGSRLITVPKFDEDVFLKCLVDYKASVLYVAPPLILYIGSSPRITAELMKTVRVTVSGAAPVGQTDILRCLQKSPPNSVYKQGFGLTECSPAVCCSVTGTENYASVGRPVPSTEVKVVRPGTAQSLPPNTRGEICVRGPQVMKGYLNNPTATREAIEADGWFHTGDIGYYDDEGQFYVVDRLKELIKVKGFQVAPAELEEVLRSHPMVDDAGVIGVADPRTGERPVAFIKASSSCSAAEGAADEEEVVRDSLRRYLAERVADYKMIDEFVLVGAIPKSAAGKILRKTLKEMYNAGGGVKPTS